MRRWTFVALALGLAGCGEMAIERERPNMPPETALTVGPPDSTDATHYRVHLQWSGTDPDGAVARFDLITIDHPAIQSHIGGDPDDVDPTRVMVEVPAMDDPRWAGTTRLDSVLVTLADTLRRTPWPDPGENPDDVRGTPHERWHTLFVRAVDDRGLPDPTPDYRSFNSTNIAPVVRLLEPVRAGEQFECPPNAVFHWDGEDPVDATTSIAPVASRYLIIESRVDITRPGSIYASFPDSLYVLPARYRWSEWRSWDRADGLGRSAEVIRLRRVGDYPNSGYYIFAVQAMDEAGAVTPVFDWKTPGKNNVALMRVSGSIGPLLTVREPALGRQTFVAGSNVVRLEVAGGQPLRFSWHADASRYGGTVVAYRYAWDLRDPSDDSQWDQDWSPTALSATARSLDGATHRFYVQARDDLGTVSQAVYELVVYPATRGRALLWVDDTDFQLDAASEAREDARWLDVLAQVATANGFEFDPNRDVFDVVENRREPPSFMRLLDHEAVVWSVRSGASGISALRRLGQFCSPIIGCCPRCPVRFRSSNYLIQFIEGGGKLWINGFQPAKQLWPDERERGREYDPINVPNWHDPVNPEMPLDSLGTTSLLYRMGIEMFEAVVPNPRHERAQTCLGFRPGTLPDTPELQVSEAWPQGGFPGRSNIEIYNMDGAMAVQIPPLVPREGISAVLYTFVSSIPADPSQGYVYPLTADGQAAFVLARGSSAESLFARAFCGFEPYLLTQDSHQGLVEYILARQFQLGAESRPGF